jgi:hypothetical protein
MFYDYGWVEDLHEMETSGVIPKLPPLGNRWKNDPRRQEMDAKDARQ